MESAITSALELLSLDRLMDTPGLLECLEDLTVGSGAIDDLYRRVDSGDHDELELGQLTIVLERISMRIDSRLKHLSVGL